MEERKTLQYVFHSLKSGRSKTGSVVLKESLKPRLSGLETVKLSHQIFRENCKYCFQPWNTGFYTLKVLPKPEPGKRILKLLRKAERSPKSLSKFECKLLQHIKKDCGNTLVLTCLACKKKTKRQMNKPKHLLKSPLKEDQNGEQKEKKKKKIRKDIFAGLNPLVILKSGMKETEQCIPPVCILNEQEKNINILASIQKKRNRQTTSSQETLRNSRGQTNGLNQNTRNQSTSARTADKCANTNSFFIKLQKKKQLEIEKQKQNEHRKKMLRNLMLKTPKSNLTDLRNFLRDFGKPDN